MSLTPEDEQRIAAIVAGLLAQQNTPSIPSVPSTPVAPVLAAPVAPTVAPVVGGLDGLRYSVTKNGQRVAVTLPSSPELLARDAADPLRNEYTALARNLTRDARMALYEPIWRRESLKLQATGLGTKAANQAAQSVYNDHLTAERERLFVRDGGKSSALMAPTIAAESRRSVGTYSDPTANMAIANVDREARLAKLRAELAALESDETPSLIPPIFQAKERVAASQRSLTHKALGTSAYQNTMDKLFRDAGAASSPKDFIVAWYGRLLNQARITAGAKGLDPIEATKGRATILRNQAMEVARRLGITLS